MIDEIKIIQEKDFNILLELLKIFEENKLTYFLAGGTFLGAVRHKGFIPWDDDIDISMPRKDYELFLNKFSQDLPERYVVQNFKTDRSYRHFITRVLDKNYEVEEIRTGEITHPAVDILPLDGSPNGKLSRAIYYKKMMLLRYLLSAVNRDIIDENRKRKLIERLIIKAVKKVPFEKIFNSYKLKLLLENSMKKYSMENSLFSGCLMGAYRTNEMVRSSWFGKGDTYLFEQRKVIGPKNYDKYLGQLYGNYMEIPEKVEMESKKHYRLKFEKIEKKE